MACTDFGAGTGGSAADCQRGCRQEGRNEGGLPGVLGGTGHTFDWSLVAALSARRDLIVAGGLTPQNVADAVRALNPFGVDVASGVELPSNPRQKDAARVRAFVAAVRATERPR